MKNNFFLVTGATKTRGLKLLTSNGLMFFFLVITSVLLAGFGQVLAGSNLLITAHLTVARKLLMSFMRFGLECFKLK